jgi:hypothetical protein
MAVLKQRLHRRNAEGSYDVIRLETTADAVIMSETDNTTVTEKLKTFATKDPYIEVILKADSWTEATDSGNQVVYKQNVTIPGTTAKSKIDPTLNTVAYGTFLDAGSSFLQFLNVDGAIHAECMDAVPETDVTVLVTVSEVK